MVLKPTKSKLLKFLGYKTTSISLLTRYSVFIVDHAWTFRPETARQHLETYPGLLERLVALFQLEEDCEGKSREEQMEVVMDAKWKHAQTYSLGNPSEIEERMPWWYVLDEFGSQISHSDTPNFRLVPFIFSAEFVAYSLLLPVV